MTKQNADSVAEAILKRPCSNPRCVLNYAHTGPCLTEGAATQISSGAGQ